MAKKECKNHPGVKAWARELCKSCYDSWLKLNNPEYKEKQSKSSKEWHKNNPNYIPPCAASDPDYFLKKNIKRTVTRQEGLKLALELQGNKCFLCETSVAKKWHQDHDHNTGVSRKVLCSKCNNGLGFFNDMPELLRKAANYIERFK